MYKRQVQHNEVRRTSGGADEFRLVSMNVTLLLASNVVFLTACSFIAAGFVVLDVMRTVGLYLLLRPGRVKKFSGASRQNLCLSV